jgi:hypothetical protein
MKKTGFEEMSWLKDGSSAVSQPLFFLAFFLNNLMSKVHVPTPLAQFRIVCFSLQLVISGNMAIQTLGSEKVLQMSTKVFLTHSDSSRCFPTNTNACSR